MKMQAPANVAHFEVDNVKYERGDDGFFAVDLPDHVDALLRLGAQIVGPDGVLVHNDVPYLDPKDARIAELEAMLAAAQQAPAAPEVPADPADVTGDTSPPAGGTPESGDKMAAALALDPKFDEMTRDEMVDWLKGVGVVVPANISKDAALKAIDDAIADYKSGQKD